MLNISPVSISSKVSKDKYEALKALESKNISSVMIKVLAGLGLLLLATLFLPWTQNIRAKGAVTTLNPEQRPQGVQSVIEGKIDHWFVREGDRVQAGDTILSLTEVKEEYMDPLLIGRTENRINAKESSRDAYNEKAYNLEKQVTALKQEKQIKLEQNTLKVIQTKAKLRADSADYNAQKVQLGIADTRLNRTKDLFEQGIRSRKDLESSQKDFQKEKATLQKIQAQLTVAGNEINALVANRTAIENEYDSKIYKTRAEENTAFSAGFTQQEEIEKLSSELSKLKVRSSNYYLTSPIDGLITKSVKEGIGELVKPGENIVTIVPEQIKLASSVYVDPQDVPLLEIGQHVQIQFDGWPAVVFSGWPNNSFGTFKGEIFAIDQFISDNGKYRILISEVPEEEKWPDLIRVGGGVNSIILLKEVPVYYELWRQMNGFPADYYKQKESETKALKSPLKKVK
ncbi:MAG: HlyD family efflux transporter periplasmic adaptor subunit [Bacteroidota bacterium]